MKYFTAIFILLSLVLTSCGGGEETQSSEGQFLSFSNKNTNMQAVKDPRTGRVSQMVPLPSHWKATSEGWKGKGGSLFVELQGQNSAQLGRHLNSADQVIREFVLPNLQANNIRVDAVIDLPEVAANNHREWEKRWRPFPARTRHEVKAVEMTNPQNQERGLLVINYFMTQNQMSSFSGYYLHNLESKAKYVDEHKAEVIHALSHMYTTPEALAAYNQSEQQKSQQGWADHNRRMRARENAFHSWQNTAKTNSEIGDIMFEGYKKRSAMRDAGHERSVDAILGRENVVDPSNNQSYKVESGYKYYFVNDFGQYIGSNDPFYNPAQDPRYSNMNWRKTQQPR